MFRLYDCQNGLRTFGLLSAFVDDNVVVVNGFLDFFLCTCETSLDDLFGFGAAAAQTAFLFRRRGSDQHDGNAFASHETLDLSAVVHFDLEDEVIALGDDAFGFGFQRAVVIAVVLGIFEDFTAFDETSNSSRVLK